MHRVFLFGSRNLYSIPETIEDHIRKIIEQTNGEVEFIVGDAGGVDDGFQRTLSALGGRNKTKVYCMDTARNNKFDLETKIFRTEFNSDKESLKIYNENNELIDEIFGIKKEEDKKITRDYYEFKDKQMCRDCTFAICFWDGKSKGTFNNITRLKAQNKYVYIYKVIE